MRNRFLITICLMFFMSLTFTSHAKKVKNIIFIIGDGMGLNHMYAAMTHQANSLHIEKSSYIGLAKTYSYDSYITDSAASGTALACGVKTRNGMLGMKPDSTHVESILHIASNEGLSTGLVVACSVTHATPAAFVAHQTNREYDKEIAADYLNTDIDVFIGGGLKYFEKSIDDRNLLTELEDKNYQIAKTKEEMTAVSSGKLAALLYEDHPPKASERGDLLLEGTKKAIELLSQNKKGFFLMIEGSQIDWASHGNNAEYLLEEMIDLDKTIAYAFDYASKNKNTLVVITADHETGGMIIADGDFSKKEVELKFTTTDHTGVIVPVYSYGAGAEKFTGIYENIDFKSKFINLYRFKNKKRH